MKELEGMPKKDPLYLLCEEYVDHKEVIRDTRELMENMKDDLCRAFKADGRESVTVRGFTVTYSECEKISCRAPKE